MDFLVHWECSSEADQVFYDEFVFTAKTGSGKQICMDRYMEWTVMLARDVHGKFQSRRMNESLTKTAMMMKGGKKMKQELATDPGRV